MGHRKQHTAPKVVASNARADTPVHTGQTPARRNEILQEGWERTPVQGGKNFTATDDPPILHGKPGISKKIPTK